MIMNKTITSPSGNITIKSIPPLHQDDKGWIINATGESNNKNQIIPIQPRIISTKPKIIRGNHYHLDETETIIFLNGKWKAIFSEIIEIADGFNSQHKINLNCTQSPICVTIPPKIAHAFENIGQSTGYIFHYSNKPYKINRAKKA